MDVATHFLVPYAAALWALGLARKDAPFDARRASLAAAFGVAGFAPDLDGLIDPLSERFDSLWWLQHRGVSHSLLGAPVLALALLGALALLRRAFPRRLAAFGWRWAFVPAAILGAWTHLALDGITLAGVPALFPFSDARATAQHFHWLVWWMFPPAAIALALHAFGKLSHRRVARAGVVAVALLVALAGFRAWTKPPLEEGAFAFPRSSELEWIVVRPLANGSWEAALWTWGSFAEFDAYADDVPAGAESAVARAKDTNAYRGFVLGLYGPMTTRAEPRADGGWNVTFFAVAQRFEASHDPRWTPTEPEPEDWGYVTIAVRGEAVEVTHRGW